MNAKDHYANHLANFYSWMLGDFEEKQREQQEFFTKNNITPQSGKVAVDLGSGHGLQSISLAKLGFNVLSIDFNKQLLNELSENKKDLTIETIHEEANAFLKNFDDSAEVIVCMGDTLTHFENVQVVEELISNISQKLAPGGKLVLSFRELTNELTGEQRFIAVKSDDSRILTCFLEYFPNHVTVHDILHEKQSGKWIQKVSSYPKLRLSEDQIVQLMALHDITHTSIQRLNGMLYIVGQKIN